MDYCLKHEGPSKGVGKLSTWGKLLEHLPPAFAPAPHDLTTPMPAISIIVNLDLLYRSLSSRWAKVKLVMP